MLTRAQLESLDMGIAVLCVVGSVAAVLLCLAVAHATKEPAIAIVAGAGVLASPIVIYTLAGLARAVLSIAWRLTPPPPPPPQPPRVAVVPRQ